MNYGLVYVMALFIVYFNSGIICMVRTDHLYCKREECPRKLAFQFGQDSVPERLQDSLVLAGVREVQKCVLGSWQSCLAGVRKVSCSVHKCSVV